MRNIYSFLPFWCSITVVPAEITPIHGSPISASGSRSAMAFGVRPPPIMMTQLSRFPGRSQPLGLGRYNKEAHEDWNNCFDQCRPTLVGVVVDPKYLLHLASPHWHRRFPRCKRQREPGHWAELPVDSVCPTHCFLGGNDK